MGWHGIGHARVSNSEPPEVGVEEDNIRLGTELTTHTECTRNSAAEDNFLKDTVESTLFIHQVVIYQGVK